VRDRSQFPDLPPGNLFPNVSVLLPTSTSKRRLKTYYFNIHFNTPPWAFLNSIFISCNAWPFWLVVDRSGNK